MNKPNILLITTDTQRWDTLRCMGSAFAISPNADRLAAEGVLFEQGHTSAPVCTAARTSLMTGLHTPIHGVVENGIRRREPLPMFPDRLKELGYYNLMIGKTHFGPVPASFDVVHEATEKSSDASDAYAGFIRPQGYSRVTSTYEPNPVPEELFMEAFLVDTTIKEIGTAVSEGKGPFFAYCSMVSPHEPFDPPGRFAHLFDEVELPPICYTEGEMDAFPDHLKMMLGTLDGSTGRTTVRRIQKQLGEEAGAEAVMAEIERQRKLYYGLAAYCDEQLGRLLDYLDESGLRGNTLVIFSSDHGTQLFDHGFADKHNYYDESWRVPFILSMPGTLPSGEKRDFAIWNDIPATILSAAGGSDPFIQGFDLFTPLAQGLPSPRKCAVATLYKSAALATRRWKLEYYFQERKGRLFDRVNDPHEQVDLFDNPRYREIRGMMVEALLGWRSDLSDVRAWAGGTGGGGPVARKLASYTLAMKGMDAEQRLNEWAEEIDKVRVAG